MAFGLKCEPLLLQKIKIKIALCIPLRINLLQIFSIFSIPTGLQTSFLCELAATQTLLFPLAGTEFPLALPCVVLPDCHAYVCLIAPARVLLGPPGLEQSPFHSVPNPSAYFYSLQSSYTF